MKVHKVERFVVEKGQYSPTVLRLIYLCRGVVIGDGVELKEIHFTTEDSGVTCKNCLKAMEKKGRV